ncbi:MAG: flagellar hook-basal body complex protein FliE [Pseudomonadota bacterium]
MSPQTTGVAEVMAMRRDLLSRSETLREVRAARFADTASAPGVPRMDFAQTLNGALQKVSAVQQRSADMQTGYERGEVTDIAQVMLARQEAGVAFEATLQVRNKLLNAYQEIMRMGA